jgi:hypothetical protein
MCEDQEATEVALSQYSTHLSIFHLRSAKNIRQ